MDAHGLPVIGAGIDYTKVQPIQHRRTLAFLNHFVTRTAGFLNHFANVCEEKLQDIDFRLQRLQITVQILETKLDSIPGLDGVSAAPYVSSTPAAPATASAAATATATTAPSSASTTAPPTAAASGPSGAGAGAGVAAPAPAAPAPAAAPEPVMTNRQDPRYAPFFKMINVGVPLPAAKMKCAAAGLDPDILEKPDEPMAGARPAAAAAAAATPAANAAPAAEEEIHFSSSEDDANSDFSDD